MSPKTDPKSVLTLSASHDLRRWNACSPEDYPPYERVPPAKISAIADLRIVTDPLDFAFHFAIWTVSGLTVAHLFGLLR